MINRSLIVLLVVAQATCALPRKKKRPDNDEYKPRRRPPVLITAKRLKHAIVERKKRGRAARSDVEELRFEICEGKEDRPAIFYQLVIGHHWHYYWLCAEAQPRRAMTSVGQRLLFQWISGLKQQAGMRAANCPAGSQAQLFATSHKSGTHATAHCNGIIALTYLDGGQSNITFSPLRNAVPGDPVPPSHGFQSPAVQSPPATQPTVPSVHPNMPHMQPSVPQAPAAPAARQQQVPRTCPACPAPTSCPPQRSCPPAKPCPKCPPPKPCPPPPKCPTCPKPNTTRTCKAFGEKAFWQGVSKACQKVCTAIYRQCRKIDPKTALCYRLSEYCAGLKGVCRR